MLHAILILKKKKKKEKKTEKKKKKFLHEIENFCIYIYIYIYIYLYIYRKFLCIYIYIRNVSVATDRGLVLGSTRGRAFESHSGQLCSRRC